MNLKKLKSSKFDEYLSTLQDFKRNIEEVCEDDVICMMRVYYWHDIDSGFQDIYDHCVDVMKALSTVRLDIDESDFDTLGKYLSVYVLKGDYWGSEAAASLATQSIIEKLKQVGTKSKEIPVFQEFLRIIKKLEEAQYLCYDILSKIADKHLDTVYDLTVTLAPVYQSFIIHSLEVFEKNPDVIKFYERYISETENKELKEEAEKYLARVK
jgi:hypothetical protein